MSNTSRLIVFSGNCQANALYMLYRDQIAPLTGDRTVFANLNPATTAEEQALLERQVVVSQVVV